MALFRFNASTGKLVPITSEGNIGLPVGAVQGFALGTQSPNWLLCDGRDTTGTEDELQTHYPALYTYLGNSNVLPTQFDHNKLSDIETITLPNRPFASMTMDYDGILSTTFANTAGGGAFKFAIYVNGIAFTGGSGGSGPTGDTITVPFKKGDKVYYYSDGQSSYTSYVWYYKQPLYIKATSAGIEVDRGLYATKGMLDLGPDYANGVTTQLSTTQGGTSTGVLTTTFAATEDCYFVARHYTLNAGSVNVSTSLLIYYGTDTTYGTEIYRASQPSVYGAGVANPPIRLSAGETITIIYTGYNDRGYCKNYTVYPVKRGN